MSRNRDSEPDGFCQLAVTRHRERYQKALGRETTCPRLLIAMIERSKSPAPVSQNGASTKQLSFTMRAGQFFLLAARQGSHESVKLRQLCSLEARTEDRWEERGTGARGALVPRVG